MSNTMYIEAIEMRPIGDKFAEPSYGLIAYDAYGSMNDLTYDSADSFFARYPTRLSVVEEIFGRDAFDGSGTIEGNVIKLNCVTCILWEGFPEDDSITSIEKEQ